MTAEIVQLKQYESQFVCTKCGADRDCACHAPGRKKDAVLDYFKNNPEASTRQAAADLGVSKSMVAKVAHQVPTSGQVTGKDGKSYPAKKSRFDGKDEDESAGALANFKSACNQWLPKLNKEDLLVAADYFAQKSGVF